MLQHQLFVAKKSLNFSAASTPTADCRYQHAAQRMRLISIQAVDIWFKGENIAVGIPPNHVTDRLAVSVFRFRPFHT